MVELKVLIIASSPESDIEYIGELYRTEKPDKVICADGGSKKADTLGIKPYLHIGDFDSSEWKKSDKGEKYDSEKDWSDFEAAINIAWDMGASSITVTGATGGRYDHALANVFTLLDPELYERDIKIADSKNIIRPLKRGRYKKPEGFKYMGIVAADEKIEGVTLKGVKYPVEGAVFYRYESLGISNEIIEEWAEVDFQKGKGFIIFSKD